MDLLPYELIDSICQWLTIEEMSVLSLTNKQLYQFVTTNYFYLFCRESFNANTQIFICNLMRCLEYFRRYYLCYPHHKIYQIRLHFRSHFINSCKKGYLDVMEWLLEVYPQMNTQEFLTHAFTITCNFGHLNIAKKLVKICPNISIVTRSQDALVSACTGGQAEVAIWLIETYPQIDTSINCYRVLSGACSEGKLETAKMLVKLCCNKYCGNNCADNSLGCAHTIKNIIQNNDFFMYICKGGHLDIAKWIIKICHESTETRNYLTNLFRVGFYGACVGGHLRIAKWLLKKCPQLDIRADYHNTIIYTCMHGRLEVAKWLKEIYPSYDYKTHFGYIFEKTCYGGSVDMAKWLIEMYYDMYSISDITNGQSVIKDGTNTKKVINTFIKKETMHNIFKIACQSGHLDMAKWLLEISNNYVIHNCKEYQMADIQSTNVVPITCAQACISKHFSTVCSYNYGVLNLKSIKFFVEEFPEVDVLLPAMTVFLPVTPQMGAMINAFEAACLSGHLEVVKLLIKKYPQIDIRANDDSAFRYGCYSQSLEVPEFLLGICPTIDINAAKSQAFRNACSMGELWKAEWLFTICKNKNIQLDIHAMDHEAFRGACKMHHLTIARWLTKLCPEYTIIQESPEILYEIKIQ